MRTLWASAAVRELLHSFLQVPGRRLSVGAELRSSGVVCGWVRVWMVLGGGGGGGPRSIGHDGQGRTEKSQSCRHQRG